MLELLDPLLDLVLPRRCAGCGHPGVALCTTCRSLTGPLWASLAVPGTRLDGTPDRLAVVAATDYAGAARTALLAYKERGRRDLAPVLAAVLTVAVRAFLERAGLAPRDVVLVGVPSTRRAAARRGGDHVFRLARISARVAGVRAARGVLRVSAAVQDSSGLSATERARNLDDSMRATRAPRDGRLVVLADDVVSSGATLREAHRALLAAGWPIAGAVAVAATPPAGSGAAVRWIRPVLRHPLAVHSRRV